MTELLVSDEAFVGAVQHGDILLIEEYLAQEDVAAEVEELNAHIQANPHASGAIVINGVEIMPWYVCPPQSAFEDFDDSDEDDFHIFRLAIQNGQVEVIQWFFALDRVPTMGATLARFLSNIAGCAIEFNGTEVLEILLTSPVFTDVLSSSKRAAVLQDTLREALRACSHDGINLLLAHGASVEGADRYSAVQRCAAYGTAAEIDLMIENGAAFVGSLALKNATVEGNAESAARLLQLGVDTKHSLWMAVDIRNPVLTKLYLDCGFMDVDTRCEDHDAPLLTSVDRGRFMMYRDDRQFLTTEALLEFGANPNITNKEGYPAIHKAAGSCDPRILELLLQFGADANAKNPKGKSVLDCLRLEQIYSLMDQQDLLHLLKYGADPFAVGASGRSACDRLQETESGREFIAANAEFFRQNQSSTVLQGAKATSV